MWAAAVGITLMCRHLSREKFERVEHQVHLGVDLVYVVLRARVVRGSIAGARNTNDS